MYRELSADFRCRDSRGELVQLVHKGYEQVNVLRSVGGTFRGGHFHKQCREAFYVASGSVEVTLRDGRRSSEHRFAAGDFFEIEPWTVHSMRFPEDCILVALYDRTVEFADGTKDIYPEEAFCHDR